VARAYSAPRRSLPVSRRDARPMDPGGAARPRGAGMEEVFSIRYHHARAQEAARSRL